MGGRQEEGDEEINTTDLLVYEDEEEQEDYSDLLVPAREEDDPYSLTREALVPDEMGYLELLSRRGGTGGTGMLAPEPVGIGSAFLHGASLGFAGEEPNTGWGTVADVAGTIASAIAVTKGVGGLLGRVGVSGGSTLAGQMAFEGAISAPFDAAYLASPLGRDTENPELMLPLFTGLNMAMVPLGRLFAIAKSRVTTPAVDEVTGARFLNVLDSETTRIMDEAEGINFEAMLRGEPGTPTVTPYSSTLEENITNLNRLGDEYRMNLHNDALRENLETVKYVFGEGSEGASILAGERAIREATDEFLTQNMGRVLPQDEQLVIWRALDANGGVLGSADNFNKRAFELWNEGQIDSGMPTRGTSQSSRWNRKTFGEEVQLFVGKVRDIEDAVSVGLPPNSTYKEIVKRSEDVMRELTKIHEKTLTNPAYKRIVDEATKQYDEALKNRGLGVSADFAATRGGEELYRLAATNALFSRVDDVKMRADEITRLISNIQGNAEAYQRNMKESLKKALNKDYNTEKQTQRIQTLVSGKGRIEPKEFAGLRTSLARYIIEQLHREVAPEFIEADLGKQLSTLRKEMAAVPTRFPDDVASRNREIAQLMGEEEKIKAQIAQQFFSNQTIARTLASRSGNANFAKAVDYYFAALGDPIAQSHVVGRKLLGRGHIARDITANRTLTTPRPSVDPRVDTTGKPTGTSSIINSKTSDMDPGLLDDAEALQTQLAIIEQGKDLDPVRRLFGSPEVNARVYKEKATLPELKTLYGSIEDLYKRGFEQYNKIQEDLTFYKDELLEKFHQRVLEMGENGSKAIALIDDVSRTANALIDEGLSYGDIEEALAKKIRAQSQEVQDAYKQFRDMDDWIYDKGISWILENNSKVDRGLLPESARLAVPARRPGHVHFAYDGDFRLMLVDESGERFVGYVMGRDQAADEIISYLERNPDAAGRFVLTPKLVDHEGDLVKLGDLVKDVNRTMGVDITQLRKLIGEDKFNGSTIYDVFYGARKERLLGLEEKRLDTLRSTTLSALAAIRFSRYMPLVMEGRQLARTLKDSSLPTWADSVSTYVNDLVGVSRGLEKTLDNHLQGVLSMVTERVPLTRDFFSALGITPGSRITRAVGSSLTFLSRVLPLGFNPATALINTALLGTNVIPVTTLADTMWASKNVFRWRKSPEGIALLKKGGVSLRQSGILFGDEFRKPDVLLGRGARAWQKVDDWSMAMFNATEDYTRGVTLLAAYKHGERMAKGLAKGVEARTWQEKLLRDIARGRGQKVTNREVLDEYAVHIMRNTNFDYSVSGLSELARNPATKPFMQFKTFLTKEIEFLFGGGLPLTHKERFLALGIMGSIGGLFAMPGIEDIDAISRLLFNGASPKLWMDTYLPEMLTAGLPAAIGIDLSDRVTLGSTSQFLNPETFPFGLGVNRIKNALLGMKNGTMDVGSAALYTVSAAEGARQGFELLSTGELRDRYGQLLVREEDTNMAAMVARVMGFKTTIEGDVSTYRTVYADVRQRALARDREALKTIIKYEQDGRTSEARALQKKAGITNKQIKAEKRKRSMTTRDIMIQRTRQDHREEELYRDALLSFPE